MNIILASSSVARKKQLNELAIDFSTVSPDIDETPALGETAEQLVLRLSEEKARAVAMRHPKALLIAGDQVCVCDQDIIGKPYTIENAIKQLQRSSGKTLRFFSGLAVLNSKTDVLLTTVVCTDVTFRPLKREEIETYVHHAMPLQCAGSFNIEGLGISLFEKILSDDPTALLGLPMIALVSFLKHQQIKIPQTH